MFKGTTLAHGVPFLSAMAVALFSALSPIFMHELSNSVGIALQTALTQVQSSEGKARQSSEDAKEQQSQTSRSQH
jgi:hypothetical protein